VNTLKQVGAALHAGVLVVYGEVAGLGFVEGTMKETLENTSGLKAGQDFILAYVPTQNPQGKLLLEPKAGLRLRVAADGQTGRNVASTLFKTITDSVIQIKDVKTAEAAALFAVAKRDADAALANELAIFCEQAGVDYYEALKASGFDNPSFLPGADDDETKKEAYLFLEGAENLDSKLRLPGLARQINEDMVKHAVNLTQEALRSCDKTLRRARIAVLGTVKPVGNSAVFVKALMLKGAKVSLHDPASRSDASELGVTKTSLNEAVEGADCIVLLASEEPLKPLNLRRLKALTKAPSVMVDLTGTLDRGEVEAEGFIYRGLGRGTGKE
jgi:UDP-N-acetyl-D-mannosaminuronic acid dehydrogenase